MEGCGNHKPHYNTGSFTPAWVFIHCNGDWLRFTESERASLCSPHEVDVPSFLTSTLGPWKNRARPRFCIEVCASAGGGVPVLPLPTHRMLLPSFMLAFINGMINWIIDMVQWERDWVFCIVG